MFLMLGYGDIWQSYLNFKDESYTYNFSKVNMELMGIFIFLFFLSFHVGSIICKRKYIEFKKKESIQFENIFLIFNWVFFIGFIFVYPDEFFVPSFNRETNLFYQICVLMIFITTSSSLNFLMNKRFFLFFLNIFPCIAISFITTERPYLAPIIGIIFSWLIMKGNNDYKKIFKITLVGLVSLFIMRIVRMISRDEEIDYLDLLISRDVSTSVLYYIFERPNYFETYTNGKATIFLILTGIYPEFLLGNRDFSKVDIPSILAYERFSWSFGTIHPTIFGWLFMDLAWFSLLFAFFFGFIVSWLNSKTRKLSLQIYSIFIVAFRIQTRNF